MLHNTRDFLSAIDQQLVELERSVFDFHLTGIRFFGGWTHESDWDFITADDDAVVKFLEDSRFKLNEEVQDYLDPMTTKVYTKYFCDCEYWHHENHERGPVRHIENCLKIDIQVCSDKDTKLKIRDILKEGFMTTTLPGDKIQRNKLWTMVYKLVKSSE